MLRILHKKFQRVSDLIAEYDEDEDRYWNPNPALHDFIQKLKFILSGKNEIARKDGANFLNLKSNRTDNVSPSSSSSSQSSQIAASASNLNPKVIEALGNHVVLTEICKFGSYGDLKNFRLINKQWMGIANSAIIQKRLWNIRMKYKFGVRNDDDDRDECLSYLNDFIEASGGSLPLTTLDFSDFQYFNSPAFHRFFALMGPSIKHVKFINFGPVTQNEFIDLLMKKIPNVDHIDAGKIVFKCKNTNESRPPQLQLPSLKTIRFVNDESEHDPDVPFKVQVYYPYLLRAATKLNKILDFPVQLMDVAVETRKMGCIQKFKIDVKNLGLMTCSPLYVKFFHTEPKLTSLSITRSPCAPHDDFSLSPELAPSLSRILISSKDTLKHLQCVPRFFPVDFQLPKFPKLEFLTVVNRDNWDTNVVGLPRVFPARCDCSEIFANVHTVSLDVIFESREFLFKYFPNQVFPSVKTLEFQANLQLGRSLTTNFPNLSHIKIIDYETMIFNTKNKMIFYGVLRDCELNNQIESLEFHQCLLARSGLEYHLDSLFTGVPIYAVPNLLGMHKDGKASEEDENIEFDRVKEILKVIQTQQYAFRNSGSLRRIKIIFNDWRNQFVPLFNNQHVDSDSDTDDGFKKEEVEPLTPVISLVSCVYGFSLMPNLEQVIIGYDHYLPNASDIAKVFKPFAQFPYVKIVHEPTIVRSSRDD